MRYLALMLMFVNGTMLAAVYTVDDGGIDSLVTGLDGSGILIGQVEDGRPGKPGYDTNPNLFASNTVPTGVYFGSGGGMDLINSLSIDDHATTGAGVMIAKDHSTTGQPGAYSFWRGVASNAELHSAAYGGADVVGAALTLNRIATLAGGTVRATNISFSFATQPFIETLDGNAHLTQFVDWSARRHDLLYVVAWGNNFPFFPERLPTDDYNGVTIAASIIEPDVNGPYRKFGPVNATDGDAIGDRTSIDLLAPGHFIRVLETGD